MSFELTILPSTYNDFLVLVETPVNKCHPLVKSLQSIGLSGP